MPNPHIVVNVDVSELRALVVRLEEALHGFHVARELAPDLVQIVEVPVPVKVGFERVPDA